MNVLLVLVIMVAILGSIHPVRGIEEDEDYHGSEGSEHRFLGSEESKGSEGGEKVVKAKVVTCYLDSSSLAKEKDGGYYTVEALEEATKYCTHIIYGFANLDSKTFKIKSHEPWLDLKTVPKGTLCCPAGGKDCDAGNNYKLVTDLKTKNSKLKVLLAIGGATDSEGTKYSDLVADATKMDNFIIHAKKFLTDHNFDGLDIDWEEPGDKDEKTCFINTNDRANFVTWVKKLKVEFEKHNKDPVNVKKKLSLTAAVFSQKGHNGLDIKNLCKELDYIHLMTYDFHGTWDSEPTTVQHHAPLYKYKSYPYSVKSGVNHWKLACGEDNKHKLVVGIPLYGRTFTLKDKNNHKIGSKAYGRGATDSVTDQKGWISYREICRNIKSNGWTKVIGNKIIGPYAYGTDLEEVSKTTWVGYDDADMAKKKAEYVKEQELGGVFVWSIDYADYDNTCGGIGGEKYPLLKKMSDVLNPKSP